MDLSKLKLVEIRKIYKDLFPGEPVGGKGITRQYLIDRIEKHQKISETTEELSVDSIREYYRTTSESNDIFELLDTAIKNTPDPNKFSTKWKLAGVVDVPEWNEDEAWKEYHREMGSIGNDDISSEILENIQEQKDVVLKKPDSIIEEFNKFGKMYPVVTLTLAYLNGRVASYVVLYNTKDLEIVKKLKKYITKNSQLFTTTDEINEYVQEIIADREDNKKEMLKNLLAKPITGTRETFSIGSNIYTFPEVGDVIYFDSMTVDRYMLIVKIYREKQKRNINYSYIPLRPKKSIRNAPVIRREIKKKSDLVLPDNLQQYLYYPSKCRLDCKEEMLFIGTTITDEEVRRLQNIPIDNAPRLSFTTKNGKKHLIPVEGDILRVKTLFYTYYLVVSLEEKRGGGIDNIWYNVVILHQPDLFGTHRKTDFSIQSNTVIKYFPKYKDTQNKEERILFI